MSKIPRLFIYHHTMGSDPEFFLQKEDRIVGSEVYIPEDGWYPNVLNRKFTREEIEYMSRFTQDGIQVEFNPINYGCRAGMTSHFRQMFLGLEAFLKSKDPKIELNFDRTVTMKKDWFEGLSEKSRILGCAPSMNIYDPNAQVGVDPKKYMKRSAGGHLHIGFINDPILIPALKNTPEKFVMMYDILVGNTSVLLDQDKGNIERRKVYGRAGEYRLPRHGLEYRTPSNFWLGSPLYLSFIFGVCRLATSVVYSSLVKSSKHDYVKGILERVNILNVIEAINTNNFDLALKNFTEIEPYLVQILPEDGNQVGLSSTNLKKFRKFVENGVNKVVKTRPMEQWRNTPLGLGNGFGYYLDNVA